MFEKCKFSFKFVFMMIDDLYQLVFILQTDPQKRLKTTNLILG